MFTWLVLLWYLLFSILFAVFQAFIHVSSAYVNADRKSAEEIIYPSPGDPDKIIEMCENLPEEELVKNAPQ